MDLGKLNFKIVQIVVLHGILRLYLLKHILVVTRDYISIYLSIYLYIYIYIYIYAGEIWNKGHISNFENKKYN